MKNHWMFTISIACWLTVFMLGCKQQPAETRAADAAAIRQADSSWSKTAESKQLEEFVGYVLDDAVVLGSNAPIVVGKQSISAMFRDEFALPGFTCKWQPEMVEAARSGDLGYSRGTYELSVHDPKGNPIVDRGKYATVWKKQDNGTWKVALDMFNSELPAPSK